MAMNFKVTKFGSIDATPVVTVDGFVNKEEAENYKVSLELGSLIGELTTKGINVRREAIKSIKKILMEVK